MIIKLNKKPGYAKTNPSGILPFAFISLMVNAQTRFPPAESPIRITFFGSISRWRISPEPEKNKFNEFTQKVICVVYNPIVSLPTIIQGLGVGVLWG